MGTTIETIEIVRQEGTLIEFDIVHRQRKTIDTAKYDKLRARQAEIEQRIAVEKEELAKYVTKIDEHETIMNAIRGTGIAAEVGEVATYQEKPVAQY